MFVIFVVVAAAVALSAAAADAAATVVIVVTPAAVPFVCCLLLSRLSLLLSVSVAFLSQCKRRKMCGRHRSSTLTISSVTANLTWV